MQADSNDPDSVGFVQWRVSWYVGGEDGACVINFMALWDDFLVARCKAMAKVILFFDDIIKQPALRHKTPPLWLEIGFRISAV